jgi:hypothetical protein
MCKQSLQACGKKRVAQFLRSITRFAVGERRGNDNKGGIEDFEPVERSPYRKQEGAQKKRDQSGSYISYCSLSSLISSAVHFRLDRSADGGSEEEAGDEEG